MNQKKTKCMIISRDNNAYTNQNIYFDNEVIERVKDFKYLDSWLNESWTCDKEIRCRIEMARASFRKFKNVLCNNTININLRLRFLRCYVWSEIRDLDAESNENEQHRSVRNVVLPKNAKNFMDKQN